MRQQLASQEVRGQHLALQGIMSGGGGSWCALGGLGWPTLTLELEIFCHILQLGHNAPCAGTDTFPKREAQILT